MSMDAAPQCKKYCEFRRIVMGYFLWDNEKLDIAKEKNSAFVCY